MSAAHRTTAREHYDAIVSLQPHSDQATHTYAVVKMSYEIEGENLVPTEATPLVFDREADSPIHDLAIHKTRSDIVIQGFGYPGKSGGRRQGECVVRIGEYEKRIRVWGRRFAEPHGKALRFTEPEPFDRIPLDRQYAYGGIDHRVPTDQPRPRGSHHGELMSLLPGEYPRNPTGTGYVVGDIPLAPIQLPNFEDPENLLTAANLRVTEPTQWFRQPLPWCVDRLPENAFARYARRGGQPWFMPPDETELEEVTRRLLATNWFEFGPHEKSPASIAGFDQEASLGMSLRDLEAGTPFELHGMTPGPPLKFTLPPPIKTQLQIESLHEEVKPTLTSVLIDAEDRKVRLTYVAILDKTPRAFRPEFHSFIPLAVSVDDDRPILYERLDLAPIATEPTGVQTVPHVGLPAAGLTETTTSELGPEATRVYQPDARGTGMGPQDEWEPETLRQAKNLNKLRASEKKDPENTAEHDAKFIDAPTDIFHKVPKSDDDG